MMSINKLLFLCLLIFTCITAGAKEQSAIRKTDISIGKTVHEKEILDTVRKVYEIRSREYFCWKNGRSIKGNFSQKFSSYFSNRIMSEFFKNGTDCHVVASARFGFLPLDNPDVLDDKQFVLLKIASPEITDADATVEVRFWTRLDKTIDPNVQDHGGAIVYLRIENNKWKISNFESVDLLGSNGFHALFSDYPSKSSDEWKGMDYSQSLKSPTRQ